jgi:hypothetical protein
MAVFMNMLEADAGLGGDLSDFLFQDNSWFDNDLTILYFYTYFRKGCQNDKA